jgi:hypothetical protein
MATAAALDGQRSIEFKVGWWVLFAISVLSAIGHALLLLLTSGEEVLFIGWTTMNVYALVVLLTAYRGGQYWAWWATWLMPASYALLILFDSAVGPGYLGVAALMAGAQMMTRPAFR